MPFQSVPIRLVLVRIPLFWRVYDFYTRVHLALESPFYTKTTTSTYWDECFEHLECLGRGSFAEVWTNLLDRRHIQREHAALSVLTGLQSALQGRRSIVRY